MITTHSVHTNTTVLLCFPDRWRQQQLVGLGAKLRVQVEEGGGGARACAEAVTRRRRAAAGRYGHAGATRRARPAVGAKAALASAVGEVALVGAVGQLLARQRPQTATVAVDDVIAGSTL